MAEKVHEAEEVPDQEDAGLDQGVTQSQQRLEPEDAKLCCHLMQHEGGAFGCTLAAGHSGDHNTPVGDKRSRVRQAPVRLEPEGRRNPKRRANMKAAAIKAEPTGKSEIEGRRYSTRCTSNTAVSLIAQTKNPAKEPQPPASTVASKKKPLESAEEAVVRGYFEKPAKEVDKKLFEGAAAAGWRVTEQWLGGGHGMGKWFYFAPDGTRYKSATDAMTHQNKSQNDEDSHTSGVAEFDGGVHGHASIASSAAGTCLAIWEEGNPEHGYPNVSDEKDEGESDWDARDSDSNSAFQGDSELLEESTNRNATDVERALRYRLAQMEVRAKKWEKQARQYHGMLVKAHKDGRRLYPIAAGAVTTAGGVLPVPLSLRQLHVEPIPDIL
eukprot:scaffold68915_cov31-Tisochrysis_lutea.AAC.1